MGVVAAVLLVAATTEASPPSANSAAPSGSAAATADIPLEELPTLPPLDRPAPKAAATQALDARLEQLLSKNVTHPVEPRVDFAFLLGDLDEDAVPAIAHRLDELRKSLDGAGAQAMLERARKEGARALDRGKRSRSPTPSAGKAAPGAAPDGAEVDGDWLQFALALGKRDSGAWRDLVQVYGMMRMLESIGSTAAVRVLIDTYAYFGELVRIDLQRALERLKDRAVPALIEAREHDAKRVREWARRELAMLGRAIPGEAVSTNDPNVLADVLLAFGRVKDVDAARVILSYAASDRVHLRRAARQAIVALGEAAVWHLRDAYESVSSEKAPRSWDHRRLAQELFRLHDRARLTAVHELMEQGVALAKQGDHTGAVARFDQVLARSPLYERRKDMAPSYVAHAAELTRERRLEDALLALRKAQRLDPNGPEKPRIEARVAFLEGKLLADRGTPDAFVLRRALELDPANAEARDLLQQLEEPTVVAADQGRRRAVAAAAALFALFATVWLARRPGATKATRPTIPPAPADLDEGAEPEALGGQGAAAATLTPATPVAQFDSPVSVVPPSSPEPPRPPVTSATPSSEVPAVMSPIAPAKGSEPAEGLTLVARGAGADSSGPDRSDG